MLHLFEFEPVGSQAPNPVNSHKILNTFYRRAPVAPIQSTRPVLLRRHRRPAVISQGRAPLQGEPRPTSSCSAAASPARRPPCISPSAATRSPARGPVRRLRRLRPQRRSNHLRIAAGQKALAAQVGREDARRLFDLSIEALDCTQSNDPRLRHRLRLPRPITSTSPPSRATFANCRTGSRNCTRTTATSRSGFLNRDELQAMCAASATWPGSSTRAAATCTPEVHPRAGARRRTRRRRILRELPGLKL
jgi:hypothetical protein